jgi:Family of unknown function (DUF6504)
MPAYTPIQYIDEPIEPVFIVPPMFEKIPGCPAGFVWNETTYRVDEMLSEWHDYTRRGRSAKNMRPEHAAVAAHRGSWGVGRDWFRVRIHDGRIFDLYYDRAPKGSDQRKGAWRLVKEMKEEE